MTSRTRIIISTLGLVLSAVLVTAWWFLGDDGWIKGKIEDTVSDITGRSFSIDGTFALDWSAKPVLVANNIHLSNPAWAINPDLASIDYLELSIDLFSIFADQIRIDYIVINGLVIALEEHESGETSWDIEFGQEEPVPTNETPSTDLPVNIGRITLAGFTLLHEAPDRTVPLDFYLEQLELKQEPDQQIQFSTDGRFGGEGFDLAGNLGPLNELVAGGKTSHDIKMTMGEIALQSKGGIEQSSTLSGANIKLTFSGPEFEWILTQFAIPGFSHGDFDFRLDLQTTGDQTRLDLDGDLGSLQANARGDLNDLAGTADLTAEVSGDDLGGLLEVVGASGIPRNPFSLKVDISHASGMFQLQTLALETGDNSVSVTGQMGDWPQLADTELDFSVTGPDLGSWSAALPAEILPGEILPDTDFNLSGQVSRAGSQPVSTDTQLRLGDSRIQLSGSLGKLPSMTGADLTVTADGPVDGALIQMLGVKGIPGDDFGLTASLGRDASYYYLKEVIFNLADNHLDLSGKLGNWPELEGTDLVFSLGGPDLSIWSPILKLENVSASAFSLDGKMSKTVTGLGLDKVRLELGGSYFVVNGTMGELPGFAGAKLSVDAAGPSFAEFRYLPGLQNAPALPFKINGNIGMGDAALTFDDFKLELGKNSMHLDGQMGLNDQLEGSNFQSRVIVPNLASLGPLLGVEGLPGEQLAVNGNYQRIAGGWSFQLSDGSFAGASFESEGTFTDIDGRQQVEAVSHLTAPNLAQLALIAGVENLPEQPIDIKGFARYDAGQIEVRDMQGKVGDSQFKVSAKAVNSPTWVGSEITLSASGQDIGQLMVNREFEDALPFSLDGSIAKNDRNIRINSVKASLGAVQASADGIIGNPDDMSDTDVQLAVTAPSLRNIGQVLDYPLPDDPFRLSARFLGSLSAFRASQLEMGLGSSDLTGELSVDLADKPSVNAILKSNYLDLSWLQRESKEEGTGEKPAQTSKKGMLIPDDPIEISQLDLADSDIEMTMGQIDFPNLTFRNIHIRSRVKDGNLYLEPFQVSGEDGGLLSGSLTVERELQSDITSIKLSLEGDDVQLGIGQFEGQDPDTFREADVVANLSGAGVTYRDLAASLNGHIEVVQGPGLTESAGLGLIFGNLIGEVLNLLNPFAKTEKYTKNECAVAVVNIESGVVTVEPLVSQTSKMTMVAKGVVDLNTEKIQFSYNTKLRKGIGVSASMVVNPFVSVTGTLKSPIIGLDPSAVAVKGTIAVATLGISLLTKSLADRYFSSKDPCGDALKKSREQSESSKNKGKKKK